MTLPYEQRTNADRRQTVGLKPSQDYLERGFDDKQQGDISEEVTQVLPRSPQQRVSLLI